VGRVLDVKVTVDTETDRFAVWKDGIGWVEVVIADLLAQAGCRCDIVGDGTPPCPVHRPHPVLVKYGLEDARGDPAAIVERHLVNNHAATVGFWELAVEALKAQLADAQTELRDALRKWGEHLDDCAVWHRWGTYSPACSCGLDAVKGTPRERCAFVYTSDAAGWRNGIPCPFTREQHPLLHDWFAR
jgi:hypothetical protein